MEQVGTAFIEIEADLTSLRRNLERDFKRIANAVSLPEVEVRADISKAETSLKSLRSSVPSLDAEVEADVSKAEADLDDLKDEVAEGAVLPVTVAGVGGSGLAASLGAALSPAKLGLVGLGVAAGGAFVSAFNTGVELDALESRFSAQLDVTAGEAERLGEVAGDLFANAYGESVEDIGQITTDVVRGLGDEFDSLGDAELADLIADVTNIGVAFDRSSEEVSDAIRGILTNDLAGTAEEASDVLSRALQIDPSGDIVDTFREYGSELAQVGVSAEEFLSIAEAGLSAGARNTDFIADAIKEGNIRITEGAEESVAALAQLGLDSAAVQAEIAAGGESAGDAFAGVLDALAAVDDEVLKNELGVAILGTKYEDLSGDVIDAMAGASESVEGLSDASENLDASINDNLGTTLTTIGRQLQVGAGRFLQPLADGLNSALQDIIPVLSSGISNLFSSVSLSGLGGSLSGVGDALGDVFSGIDLGGLDFGFIAKGVEAVSTVFATLSEVVGDFIADNQESLSAIGQALVDVFSLIGEVLGFVFELIIDNQDIFVSIFETVGTVLGVVLDVVAFLLPVVVSLGEVLFNLVQVVLPPVISVFGFLVDAIGFVVSIIKDSLVLQFGILSAVIKTVLNPIDSLKSGFRSAFEFISTFVSQKIASVTSVLGKLPAQIGAVAGKVFIAAKNLGSKIIDGIKSGIGAVAGIAGDIAKTVGNAIKSFINSNLIDKLNAAFEFTIPIPGAPDISVNAPNIPRLALGGIFDSELTAVIGEAGAEAVIPLTRPERALDLLRESGLDQLLFNDLAGDSVSRVPSVSGGSSVVNNSFTVIAREGQDERLIGRSLLEQIAGSELSTV